MASSDLIWHYTTTAGLAGILVDHKLRATSVSFVNDPTEQEFARDAVFSALREVENTHKNKLDAVEMEGYLRNGAWRSEESQGYSNRFVVCASESKDSLDLWRGYGANDISGSYAIGLDRNVAISLLVGGDDVANWRTKDANGLPSAAGLGEGWTKLKYTSSLELNKEVKKLIFESLAYLQKENYNGDRCPTLWDAAARILSTVQATRKHVAYEAEREVRLSIELESQAPIELQERSGLLSAYVQATAASTKDGWGGLMTEPKRLPVREVITWPGAPPQVIAGIAAALAKGGHPTVWSGGWPGEDPVRVTRSRVPFV